VPELLHTSEHLLLYALSISEHTSYSCVHERVGSDDSSTSSVLYYSIGHIAIGTWQRTMYSYHHIASYSITQHNETYTNNEPYTIQRAQYNTPSIITTAYALCMNRYNTRSISSMHGRLSEQPSTWNYMAASLCIQTIEARTLRNIVYG
jgi:hypothetical protein